MKSVLTISCKLQPTPEQLIKLDETLKAFAGACEFINQTVDPKLTNNVRIQTLVYEPIREQFKLSANLAIRAINRVSANRKTAKHKGKPVNKFAPTSADYDSRIFAFREKDWSVSLSLVGGREHIKLLVSNYQIGKLKRQKPNSATLVKHPNSEFFINIQVKFTPPSTPDSKDFVGATETTKAPDF